eukprot:TRINITY_DN24620_c0_g1_i1.p1 TRINITY_DN24620_c0_g1~~TRINITY_DN24620_c0_g1_i1.p1  ORF type:complete len:292 (-),score=54.04 TRINITY_DN24620_c0_g1_i1:109-984(-)
MFKSLSAMRRVVGLSGHFLKPNFTAQVNRNRNYLRYASEVIPHPEKVAKGGEDAFFSNENAIAVADGVGGWADYGVDPAKYSRELCQNIANIVANEWEAVKKNPKELIIRAAQRTKNMGSSTCVVLIIDEKEAILRTSYIGDSGYLILRKEGEGNDALRVLFQSEEHCRSFNFPYQIGTNSDPPNMSLTFSHEIKDNDLLVVASDGLWDNLEGDQILEVVKPLLDKANPDEWSMKEVAHQIAQKAYTLSLDSSYESPFTKRARKYRLRWLGGKSDDITVVAAQVKLVQSST